MVTRSIRPSVRSALLALLAGLIALAPGGPLAAGAQVQQRKAPSADGPPRQPVAPRQLTAVRVASCDPEAASATFVAEMRARPAAATMALRFRLQAREAAKRWTNVTVPGFDRWLDARRGKTRFVYSKTLTQLTPGQYRVRVSFRWRDAANKNVGRAYRRSPVCLQRDERPDLRPLALQQDATGWVLTVTNRGAGPSPVAVAQLVVGEYRWRRRIPALRPGDQTELRFTAGGCEPGATAAATVDPETELDELDESGKTITAGCSPAA